MNQVVRKDVPSVERVSMLREGDFARKAAKPVPTPSYSLTVLPDTAVSLSKVNVEVISSRRGSIDYCASEMQSIVCK